MAIALPRPSRTADMLRSDLDLSTHAVGAVAIVSAAVVVWAATGTGYAWPAWVALALSASLALHYVGRRAVTRAPGPWRGVFVETEAAAVVMVAMVAIYELSGRGYFWPAWVLFGLALVLLGPALRAFRVTSSGVLEARVSTLERTRRGALDVQAAELRRIERDLHDGAQARLVALTMQLGRAETRVAADQPELADLLRAARGEANAAIGELRDLARGISPPVLADRGLPAAVDALGKRAAIEVRMAADLPGRAVPAVESAAYFVVAEALTNVAKHAPGAQAEVFLHATRQALVVRVSDDGPGGARDDGLGLAGLRARVEALDGFLHVESPAGGPTEIEAVLPCAW